MYIKLITAAQGLGALPRPVKRLITIAADLVALPLALWSAFALRLNTFTPEIESFWWLFVVVPVLTVPVLKLCGLYREVLRYMGPQAAIAILKGVTISAVLLGTVALLGGARSLPRSVLILYWLTALLYVGGSRVLLRALLQSLIRQPRGREPAVIYGAGAAGAQLINALDQGLSYVPVALLDDDKALQGSTVGGLKVHPPTMLERLIKDAGVRHVLLALPAASRERRRAILRWLELFPVRVKTLPNLNDIVSGNARLDEIRDVEIEDLLGRDPVASDQSLFDSCIRGKNVLVTGAGGSIGSELCRQIACLKPRRLVLYELSEFVLYQIERELREGQVQQGGEVELVPILGSVLDQAKLQTLMKAFAIETVYHAAAYKHVPMVEHNVLEGIRNNTFGTWCAAAAALAAGVETFVLISTDKAVRPTNVMGASKRLAELILQGLAQKGGKTVFCMVRFGNVLGSSGSVVPLFREQIRQGGPVTITHPEITRYFMTIPEAATLVLQAGAMAEGGDVFVLDMGEPVKILDLARQMIRLMGYQVRDETNPNGDIEIVFTGLRPGEKLYEELLIGDNVTGTRHPMIMRATEASLPWREVERLLGRLRKAYERFDCEEAEAVLAEAVTGFVHDGPGQDLLWQRTVAQRVEAEEKVAYLRRPIA
ncbi:MAG TPA: nucleoside-diphosphate sugar epimerase/dehydratase [Gammaproteobacteria bacterium]|nr:nucleoside-diphosphate sugar epimerase/dehydratase [Gammaproteobacteria bacterium]